MNTTSKRLVVVTLFALQTSGIFATSFFWESLKNPKQVGALFTCSSATGNELMRYACTHKGPKKILEIGAGTGSVTEVICSLVHRDDVIDAVEINETMCTHLKERFGKKRNVHIHCTDILQFDVKEKYDFIICTLPFANMDAGIVEAIHKKIVSLINKDGYFSCVEYILLPTIRKRVLNLLDMDTQRFEQSRGIAEALKVMRNIPPLRVHHLKIS
jgi:phospholipid N-methyltransferase